MIASIRGLLIVIMLLLAVCIGLWSYTSSIESRSAISQEEGPANEGFDTSEDNETYMTVTNGEKLYEVLPTIGTTVINQVYAKNYEKDGVIDRYATIDGDITELNNRYEFVIHFLGSDIKRKVQITIQNEATSNYDIVVGDKL